MYKDRKYSQILWCYL